MEPRAACLRCGRIRTVNESRITELCRDCREVEARTPGTRTGRPPMATRYAWTAEAIRRAHNRYVCGCRDPRTREGQRLYWRASKRRQRRTRDDESEAA